MSSPGVRLAISPHDGRCHAFDPDQAGKAVERGYAETLCGDTTISHLIAIDAPRGAICTPCATLVASELPEPREGGPT